MSASPTLRQKITDTELFGARLIPNRNAAQPNEAKIEGNFRHRENFVETGLETHTCSFIVENLS